jgi:hypothetical protein
VTALARPTDPETSHEAAASLDDVRESQRRVHDLLRVFGPTTDERLVIVAIASGWHVSPSGLRTRRHELVEAGLVVDTGQRATLASGRRAVVWAVAP